MNKIITDILNKLDKNSAIEFLSELYEKNFKEDPVKNKDYENSPKYKLGIDSCCSISMSINGYIDILEKNGYVKGTNKWSLYIPNGYNSIDEQLEKLVVKKDDTIIIAIPNCDNLVSKYNVWKSLSEFYGIEKASTIVPESFLLDKEEDLDRIKKSNINRFILKGKKQRKEGLKLINKEDINSSLKENYDIAQKYIKPFLVRGRKINLRIYLLLSLRNNKLTAYLNNFGTCIYTKDIYDETSDDFEKNITSYNLDLNIYKENPLTFKQLRTYLKDNNLDYEKPFRMIKEKISLILQVLKNQIGYKDGKFRNNLCFQVFGLDFIIDENLEPFFLECNKGPEMKPKVTIIDYPEINDNIIHNFNKIKELLSKEYIQGTLNELKKYYKNIFNDYPKTLTNDEILQKIENFHRNEIDLKAYPSEYITGNGLKVQKDTLHLMGLIQENDNNGFEKIIEID